MRIGQFNDSVRVRREEANSARSCLPFDVCIRVEESFGSQHNASVGCAEHKRVAFHTAFEGGRSFCGALGSSWTGGCSATRAASRRRHFRPSWTLPRLALLRLAKQPRQLSGLLRASYSPPLGISRASTRLDHRICGANWQSRHSPTASSRPGSDDPLDCRRLPTEWLSTLGWASTWPLPPLTALPCGGRSKIH
jgi:hypothetical protein